MGVEIAIGVGSFLRGFLTGTAAAVLRRGH